MQASQLIAKPAAPATVAKPASASKPAAKRTSSKPAPVKCEIKFAIQDFARPRAGATLVAHTAAFLELSGLADGKAMPKQQAARIIGARAVQYHTDNGNFEQTPEGLILTEKGVMFFISRAADLEMLAAFREVMTTGKVNALANVKTEAARIAL